MPLIKNVPKPLAKSVLITLGLTTAVSAGDAGIYKTILSSGTTSMIISNKAMTDIMKIVKSREESGLLIKGVSEIIEKEAKEQRGGFFSVIRYIR